MPWKYNGSVVATNKGFKKTDGYTTPKNWVTVWDNTEKANQGLTWEDPASETVSDADKLAALRTLRDMKLQETDFYALSDVTLADNMKTYRQNLRDITDSYQSLDADGFAWPTTPS